MNKKINMLADLLGVKMSAENPESVVDSMLTKLKTVAYIPYPVSLSTVDIAVIIREGDEKVLLLGRKPGQDKWQLPGGFRDPMETSRTAAQRELNEETGLLLPEENFVYLDDVFIDDKRYKEQCHKITTSFFYTITNKYKASSAIAGDDLQEVAFFSFTELKEKMNDIVRDTHHPLLFKLFNSDLSKTHS